MLLSVLAFVCRSELRRPGLLNLFLQTVSKTLEDPTRLPGHLSLLTFIGAELFDFYLLFWELLIMGDQCMT